MLAENRWTENVWQFYSFVMPPFVIGSSPAMGLLGNVVRFV